MEGPSCSQDGVRRWQNPNPVVKLELQKKRALYSNSLFVPRVGLEPTRPKRTHGPQPCLSTNFSTWAVQGLMRLCDPAGTRTQDPLIKSEML